MKTLWLIITALLCCRNCCDGAVCAGKLNLAAEIPTIRKAAERNDIKFGSDDWYLLLAIRLSENGRDGLQFGIMNEKAYNLDLQAAWCAATIIKRHRRFGSSQVTVKFINSLAGRYCPASVDLEGNKNWKKNVKILLKKLKEQKND